MADDDDPPCTSCDDTGFCFQTEKACQCEAGLNLWDDTTECANCGGEGYVYGCSWDWQCDTYDEGEGTCLCARRCEWCNAPTLTAEEQAEQQALRQMLADALAKEPRP